MAEARPAVRAPSPAPSPQAAAETGGRGHLHVADRAVQRIAQAAALEVEGVAPRGTPARSTTAAITGAIGGALGREHPRVRCEVAGHRARVHVEVVTVWPYAAAEVAAAVREHVGERLRVLAGVRADGVHVTVAEVALATTPGRRVR
ncbi:Asp23/Gls24 family envelope stress response protein [Kineococcus indalonis]|uniref:Asp23/Gls24 family envelope stress response protein n=1 Tax=Kineococcus indalonis TaxID=2696566 RepID=UPI001412E1EC|nr:Asp23/Gls24 family envelope stress response protein [Kineococcus indalonis]NAZ87475.1 Asp23/Gls24 family envelope stress response protein [Kineococcus indalonis]